MTNVALIGVGYWGPNLARNLNALPNGRLKWICDTRPDALEKISANYPGARLASDVNQVLDAPDVDAVVIATPARTHFEIASAALSRGKHVLVEKPLAMTGEECARLIELAERARTKLMVGHVFLYSPAIRKIRDIVSSGELGEIYYAYSTRANLGQIRQDVNALWNLAPHDVSILLYLFDSFPEAVCAHGITHIQPGIEDVVFAHLRFPGGVGAHIHVSWLDPGKVRQMTLVGSKKMVVYDDVDPDAKVRIIDKGVTRVANDNREPFSSFGEFQLLLRAGDVLIPKIQAVEPLRLECEHFIDCIENDQQPLTDGGHGLLVVKVLEAAQDSMRRGSVPVEVRA